MIYRLSDGQSMSIWWAAIAITTASPAVLAEEIDADLQVGAFHLAIDRLADVVHEGGAHGDVGVQTDLFRHDAGEPSDFGRVIEDVLPIAGTVFQPPHEPQNLGMQIVKPEFERHGGFLRIASSVSSLTFWTTSSIRAGWLSAIGRSMACLAMARR